MGCAYKALGNEELAIDYWEKASKGNDEPASAIFYNDWSPDKIYYQGLALQKLNKNDEARLRFNNLVHYGERNLGARVKMDYFAVSLPDMMIFDDDLAKRNNIHCNYLIGLGKLGLEEWNEANKYFAKALSLDCSHAGAIIHSSMIKHLELKT